MPLLPGTGDFNSDGIADLAYLEEYSTLLVIMLGQGDGTFAPAQLLPFLAAVDNDSSSPVLAAVDLTGSGKLDLVSASVAPPAPPIAANASILLNTDCHQRVELLVTQPARPAMR